jgi:hypothetical protein
VRRRPAAGGPSTLLGTALSLPKGGWRLAAVLWLAGAVVTWNMVFDAHVVKGARDYVDAQQLFTEGRGPRQDMERAMAAARSSGLRAACFWAGVEFVPGLAVAAWVSGRRRRARPASTPGASR